MAETPPENHELSGIPPVLVDGDQTIEEIVAGEKRKAERREELRKRRMSGDTPEGASAKARAAVERRAYRANARDRGLLAVTMNFSLPKKVAEYLRAFALAEGKTVSEILREALELRTNIKIPPPTRKRWYRPNREVSRQIIKTLIEGAQKAGPLKF